ncbi:MAG TPA: GMC oxidoreductase, partial [Sphingomonadales bacterium]
NDPEDCERIGYVPRTIHNGRRQSAAVAFLRPAERRANLTIATGAIVWDILFNGMKACGVRAIRDGRAEEYRAGREVVLAAGNMASPAILQRSGIGPADHLRALGIAVRHDSPEVGENVREHRGLVMQWQVPDELSQNREFRGLRLVANTLRYALARSGPMTNAAYEVGGWFRTRPDLPRPDAQILVAPFSFDFSAPRVQVEAHGGMNICAYGLRPQSRGRVRIRSADPRVLPEIVPNYCGDTADRRLVVDLVRQVRRFVSQGPLAEAVLAETRPGPSFESDEEIFEAYRRFGYGSYHASGSCRMGRDERAVVDSELRVRGVEGLRVVDTSVFPFILSGNTNGPAMAVAWRAADLILGE